MTQYEVLGACKNNIQMPKKGQVAIFLDKNEFISISTIDPGRT